jgi:Big-like domain-containing protein/HYR domain-containing protein/K319-like protein
MNLELLLSGRVLSMAFIFVAFLGLPALIFVYAESVAPSVPITKSISDTIPFLREVADTTPPIDTTPPVVTVPADIIVEATGPDGRIVSYESTATDTVDGNIATVCSPKSGSLFALGQTRVECTAEDKAGNNGKNQFIITVRDTTPPETTLGDVTVGWLGSITSGDMTPSVDSNFDFDGTDLVGISRYECRLDDGGWKSAHSVTDINGEKINTCTYTGVRDPGAHNFEVRAVDTSGNKDASPASFMWNIEAPDQAIQGLITRVNSIYQSLNLDSALHQAVEDLSDNSASNDPNSCYLLNSFMNDLKVQNMIGTLSLTDLNDFVKTTHAIMDNIGCLPPIANAGSPQSVEAGEKGVMLDGSDSLHADNPISFKWKQIGGSPTVEIRNSAKAKASFDAPTSDQFKDVGSSTTLTFELTVAGAGDLKSTAISTVEVNAVNNLPEEPGVNNPPVAKSQTVTTYSDKSVSINLDATDKDGDSLTYSLSTSPNHGSLSSFDKDTGTVVYTPKSGYTGNDGFTFTANDKTSTSNSAKVSISVNPATPVNTPPVAKAQSVTINRDTPASINLDATDKDGDSLTYSLSTSPNHGSLSSFDKDTGTVVYTPKSGYTGNDGFTFTANDKTSTSNSAKVSISVNSVKSNVTAPEKEKENQNTIPNTTALTNTTSLPNTALTNTTSLPNTTGGSTKMHLEGAIKDLEAGNKDAASTQLTAAQEAISGESEQAKMHFDEAMKAFSAGDTNGALTHLKAADEALG